MLGRVDSTFLKPESPYLFSLTNSSLSTLHQDSPLHLNTSRSNPLSQASRFGIARGARQLQLVGRHGVCSNTSLRRHVSQVLCSAQRLLLQASENVSLEEGALLEPLSIAVHLVRQSKIKHSDSIVVFGAGPIELLCCAVARAYSARKIIVANIQEQRLEFTKRFAAIATFEPGKVSAHKNAQRLIQENDLESGADVAIDASGVEASIQTAVHVLRQGGSYVQGGMGRKLVSFPIVTACMKE